jgi:hypothetical protein
MPANVVRTKTGKVPPVGIDIKNATYANSIGDKQLASV